MIRPTRLAMLPDVNGHLERDIVAMDSSENAHCLIYLRVANADLTNSYNALSFEYYLVAYNTNNAIKINRQS